ncbi:MAG: TorF family putative porin [Parcubacteria group bacterium]
MKVLKLALCAAAASLLTAGAASAAPDVAFNVGATTDYVFRGLTQNNFDPTAFGGVDVSEGQFYAGAWTSGVSFADAEVDLYGGYKPTLGPVSLDLGVIYYGYVNDTIATGNAAYWEGKVAASLPLGPASVGAAVYYSPEFFGETGQATYYEVNGSTSFRNATISGAVGEQMLDKKYYGVDSYMTWNLGVTVPVTDKFSLDARYIGTDDDAATAGAGAQVDKFVGTIKATF